eukprot:jgi/Ulvmu1/1432/UM011_0162.1
MSVSFHETEANVGPVEGVSHVERRTLAEINGRIVNVTCSLDSVGTNQAYSFPVDISLNRRSLQASDELDTEEEAANGQGQGGPPSASGHGPVARVHGYVGLMSRALGALHSVLRPEARAFAAWCEGYHGTSNETLPMAFHPDSALLAVARASRAVDIFDLSALPMPSAADLLDGLAGSVSSGPSGIPHQHRPPPVFSGAATVLSPKIKHQVHDMQWQPTAGCALAVAHARGVCVWRWVDRQRSPAMHCMLLRKGCSNAYMPTELLWPPAAPATAVAWHPAGTLLAAGSLRDSTVFIWSMLHPDGEPTRLRLPQHCSTHLLRWSPCGQYLFAGLNDGTFHVYETLTWRSEGWGHRACGYLVDAAWSAATQPPSLLLLCSRQLAALHFTEAAPALDAQLLPLSAPQVFDQEVSSGGAAFSAGGSLRPAGPPEVASGMVWDSKRDRLLISLKGDHPYSGHALLFTTVQQPVLSAVCVGPVFLPEGPPAAAATDTHRRVLALHCGAPEGSLVASRAADERVSVTPVAVRGGLSGGGYGGAVGPGRSSSSVTFFG